MQKGQISKMNNGKGTSGRTNFMLKKKTLIRGFIIIILLE